MLPMIFTSSFHKPVLLTQLIESLRIKKGNRYIDATLGGGGYTFEIIRQGGKVLGIDQDQDAIDYVKEKLEDGRWKLEEKKNLYLVQGNFKDLREIAHKNGFDEVAGIIFDLGMSTYQLEQSGRGFSYAGNEPLDMRMDKQSNLTAADILNKYSKERLYEIFTRFSEELHSGTIAEAIVRARTLTEIRSTHELVQLLDRVIDRIYFRDNKADKVRRYQATKARIFQALRIEVNGELSNLETGLKAAIELLVFGGRIAVVSFHSLEDRVVKLTFKNEKRKGNLKIVNTDIVRAGETERRMNPKAKSAKLRIAEKTT